MVRFAAAVAALFLAGAALAQEPAAPAAPGAPPPPEPPARELFGARREPAPLAARAIGSYAKGCLAGAQPLAVDGPGWQVMRLSRGRNFGHPALVAFLERFAGDARAGGWPGLLVGDLAQPRGGPMLTGHASHQIGLDADIWLTPMPGRTLTAEERETIGAVSMIRPGTKQVDPALFTPAHGELIRRAARQEGVARIFVHFGIKRALCERAGADRAWLNKVRPWWGHDTHFHVRLDCPPGEALCRNQDPPPPGDGCGAELDAWFAKVPPVPGGPDRPLKLADLPGECRTVLDAR